MKYKQVAVLRAAYCTISSLKAQNLVSSAGGYGTYSYTTPGWTIEALRSKNYSDLINSPGNFTLKSSRFINGPASPYQTIRVNFQYHYKHNFKKHEKYALE
jgi:hypothetical protein